MFILSSEKDQRKKSLSRSSLFCVNEPKVGYSLSFTVHLLGPHTMEGGKYLHQRGERDGGRGQGGARRFLPDSRGAQLPAGASRAVRG